MLSLCAYSVCLPLIKGFTSRFSVRIAEQLRVSAPLHLRYELESLVQNSCHLLRIYMYFHPCPININEHLIQHKDSKVQPMV